METEPKIEKSILEQVEEFLIQEYGLGKAEISEKKSDDIPTEREEAEIALNDLRSGNPTKAIELLDREITLLEHNIDQAEFQDFSRPDEKDKEKLERWRGLIEKLKQ